VNETKKPTIGGLFGFSGSAYAPSAAFGWG